MSQAIPVQARNDRRPGPSRGKRLNRQELFAERRRFHPWTEQEDAKLVRLRQLMLPCDIAPILERSTRAITDRLQYLTARGLAGKDAQVLSIEDVAQALGVTMGMVARWRRSGHLVSTLPATLCRFSRADLIDAMYKGLPLRAELKPSPEWASTLEPIISEQLKRYVQASALADAFCVNRWCLAKWQRRHRFPTPVLVARGATGAWYERRAVAIWLAAHPDKETAAAWRLLLK